MIRKILISLSIITVVMLYFSISFAENLPHTSNEDVVLDIQNHPKSTTEDNSGKILDLGKNTVINDSSSTITYAARDVLESAQNSAKWAQDTITLIFTSSAVIIALFVYLFPAWSLQQKKLKNDITALQLQNENLSQRFLRISTVIDTQSERVTAISKKLQSGIISFIESDKEREQVKLWIDSIEDDKTSIDDLEKDIDILEKFHDFDPLVYISLGQYNRYRGTFCPEGGERFFRKARKCYFKAVGKKSLKDSSPFVIVCIALCDNRLKDRKSCLKHSRIAIEIQESETCCSDPILHELVGYSLMYLGDVSAAHVAYRKASLTTRNKHRTNYNWACNYSIWGKQLENLASPGRGKVQYRKSLNLLKTIPIEYKSLGVTMQKKSLTDPDLCGLRTCDDLKDEFCSWAKERSI